MELAYGKGLLPVELDEAHFDLTTVLPRERAALENPHAVFLKKARHPLEAVPLPELVRHRGLRKPKVTIVIADHTRPVPDCLLVPWIVEALNVEDILVTILVGTGTHRTTTEAELERMLGRENLKRFRVISHDCRDPSHLVRVGSSADGGICHLNRIYCEADIRLCTGFIEPHFFAGFSGGGKAIVPGIAGLDTICHAHRAELIAHPDTTWGNIDANPLQKLIREMVCLCPPDCIVNVSLNNCKEMTDIFIGDCIAAHEEGCRLVREVTCVPAARKYPVVVTSNSGYPLDMNYYQTVKGLSAAARITEDGGSIIMASECSQGIPAESAFEKMLALPTASERLLDDILKASPTEIDQWQAQVLLQIIGRYRVYLFSALSRTLQPITRVEHIDDIGATLHALKEESRAERLSVAVLPMGPMTIPMLSPP